MEPNLERKIEKLAYLEDVPDHGRKLKALEYVNMSENDQAKIRVGLVPPGTKYPSPVKSSESLNNKIGFPLTKPDPKFSAVGFDSVENLSDWCKDLFGKDSELLPSKEQKKAA